MSHAIGTGGGRGLTAFQLKVIALVCMTLDHIAAFGFEIPGVARFEDPPPDNRPDRRPPVSLPPGAERPPHPKQAQAGAAALPGGAVCGPL